MIVKELTYPIKAKKLEALRRRLKQNHDKAQAIELEYAKVLAGHRGELSLNYFLSFLPQEQYHILHNLRLPSAQNEYFFQMDILLLSKYFFLIIEVKNLSGSITYDPTNQQLIQHYNEQDRIYTDPFLQVQRQKQQLYKWMEKASFTNPPPISTLVILSNSQTFIKANSNTNIAPKIIRPDKLTTKISEYEKMYRLESISPKELKKLCRQLMKGHTEEEYNVMEKFTLTTDDLQLGVHCPKCSYIPMFKKRYIWLCPRCKHQDRDVYLPSLQDYFYLLGRTINNPQLRNFLQISSRHSAKRMLQSLNLTCIGNTRAANYTLPFED